MALDGDRVRFTHPLFPLAVASQLTPDERRELHGRLAAVVVDVEQRARHLALAAEGPDAKVAWIRQMSPSRSRIERRSRCQAAVR